MPIYYRNLVCLANSRKPPSGRCIAGKEFEGGRSGTWIRPVSARPSREVSEEERRYENGRTAQLKDIVRIPLVRHEPAGHQVENHVFAADHPWELLGKATWPQVAGLLDARDADFWRAAESTHYGLNDKIEETEAGNVRSSLKLIAVPRLSVRVGPEAGYQGAPGRRRVRGHFAYDGGQYLLSVTDRDVEAHYLAMPNGEYNVERPVLCISLTEPAYSYAYRVIASVITEDGFDQQ